MIKCGDCGSNMIANGGVGRGDKACYYYRCPCCKRTVRRDIMDDYVIAQTHLALALNDEKTMLKKAEEITKKLSHSDSKSLALELREKELIKARNKAEAACTALLAVPTSTTLIKALTDAEADIKRLELEVEEIKREVEKQPNTERIYRWLKNIKSKESIEDYKQLIQASVAVVYSYADGGTLIFYTWQNTKELELNEVRTLLENLKVEQMAVASQKQKKTVPQ